eukprot:3070607-Rhodomonas_salina.2
MAWPRGRMISAGKQRSKEDAVWQHARTSLTKPNETKQTPFVILLRSSQPWKENTVREEERV